MHFEVHRSGVHLVWTLNFTECGLLCLLALSVHFEIYRSELLC